MFAVDPVKWWWWYNGACLQLESASLHQHLHRSTSIDVRYSLVRRNRPQCIHIERIGLGGNPVASVTNASHRQQTCTHRTRVGRAPVLDSPESAPERFVVDPSGTFSPNATWNARVNLDSIALASWQVRICQSTSRAKQCYSPLSTASTGLVTSSAESPWVIAKIVWGLSDQTGYPRVGKNSWWLAERWRVCKMLALLEAQHPP